MTFKTDGMTTDEIMEKLSDADRIEREAHLEKRFAFTAVVTADGITIGAAFEGTKGYTGTTYGNFDTYELATEFADMMNERMGLDPKEAMRIVLGTMGYGK